MHAHNVMTYNRAMAGAGGGLINPRRACTARVTVLGLCVCLSVRYSILASRAITWQTRDTSDFSVTWAAKLKGRFV